MRGVVGWRRLSLNRLFIPQGPTATTITFLTLTHELPLKAISCVIVAVCAKLHVSSCLEEREELVVSSAAPYLDRARGSTKLGCVSWNVRDGARGFEIDGGTVVDALSM